ncbi:MAG: phosphate regulon sensor histidine kinase PhoR [Gammaproteobacteria bacterium]|nr:phosphate regulon sensor histidine kinase PhoR [Gammaproteobacteria bacterium]
MDNPWSVESWRLVLVVLSALFIGLLTDYWMIAWGLPISLYIGWQLHQLYLLNRWLMKGAKTKNAPETSGIWALIVQQIYRSKRNERKQKKRLARTLKRFNVTASALPDATIVLDENHLIEWANQVSQQVLGIDRKRDTGLRIETMIRNPEFNQWINSPAEDDDGNDLEMPAPADQNKILNLRRVEFGKGQFLLTARDISQRVQLQEMRRSFVANASHELKTPLTVIMGYLEILKETDYLPEDLRPPVENANLQALRMQNILDDLLYLSRLETAELSEKLAEPVNMAGLLKQLASDMQKTMAQDTHTLKLDVDDRLIIRAVETDMDSVASNLIKNAIRHTPKGSTIAIKWHKDQSQRACLEVSDDGVGIEPEHLPKLTERFYRVDPGRSRQTGATGLGLAIVKHAMHRHGGVLEVESDLGLGSTFSACFPSYRIV